MTRDGIEFSADVDRLDVDLIHRFLAESYWAEGRSRERVVRSIKYTLCMAAYDGETQVGFGRLVTDRAVFAYLADVFVLPDYRQRGIARRLVQSLLAHPEVASLSSVLLKTADAHPLYRELGFEELPDPERFMMLSLDGH